MNILGGFLIIIGSLFVVAGFVQVIAEVVVSLRPVPVGKSEGMASKAIQATAEVITALGKLPHFALSVLLGLLLISFGQRAAAGLLLIPW